MSQKAALEEVDTNALSLYFFSSDDLRMHSGKKKVILQIPQTCVREKMLCHLTKYVNITLQMVMYLCG